MLFCYSDTMKYTKQQHIDRFWNKVDKNGPNGCWLWTGLCFPATRNCYGRFKAKGQEYRAHRFSMLLDGQDPTGWHVCHKCNNPRCVNPNHLYLGTNADNMRDKVACGNSHYKFKREFLESIQSEFEQAQRDKTVTKMAKKYGIDRTYLYRAMSRLKTTP